MIPQEVADIAQILIDEDLGLAYDEAIEVAYRIYNKLTLCKC